MTETDPTQTNTPAADANTGPAGGTYTVNDFHAEWHSLQDAWTDSAWIPWNNIDPVKFLRMDQTEQRHYEHMFDNMDWGTPREFALAHLSAPAAMFALTEGIAALWDYQDRRDAFAQHDNQQVQQLYAATFPDDQDQAVAYEALWQQYLAAEDDILRDLGLA